jgi:hypothetical protein
MLPKCSLEVDCGPECSLNVGCSHWSGNQALGTAYGPTIASYPKMMLVRQGTSDGIRKSSGQRSGSTIDPLLQTVLYDDYGQVCCVP